MKILHTVEFYSPSVGGAQEVVRQLSERLAKRGHKVTVATTRLPQRTAREINGVQIAEFDVTGNAVRGLRGEVERYREFVRYGSFDVMMNYAAQQWTTDALFPLLQLLPFPKVLVPCGFSALENPEYSSYFAVMPHVMDQYDHLIFLSNTYRDIAFARRHGLQRCCIIPNGAAEEEFSRPDPSFRARYGIPDDAFVLLTVGSHTGLKGHRLCIEAFQQAHIPGGILVIIGNILHGPNCLPDCRRRAAFLRFRSMGRKRVLLLDPPRRDVVAAYHASDIFAFGSNIECSPLVLFEAMAARLPFITVACGNAQEIIEWSRGGLLVNTEQVGRGHVEGSRTHMASLIEQMYADRAMRRQLGDAGHSAWSKSYTWERIVDQYEQLYLRLGVGSPSEHVE